MQRLITPNQSSLDTSFDRKNLNTLAPLRAARSKQRSTTVFPLEKLIKNQNSMKLEQANNKGKQSQNSNATPEDGLTGQSQAINKNYYKKSSTSKEDNKGVTRTKTARNPQQPKFNPDNYEVVYDSNKLIRKIERANKKRQTMFGFATKNTLAKKRSISSSSSSSSSSDSSSDSSPLGIGTESPLQKIKVPSNRPSVNRNEDFSPMNLPKTPNRASYGGEQTRRYSNNELPKTPNRISYGGGEVPNRRFSGNELQVPGRVSFGGDGQNRRPSGNELQVPGRVSFGAEGQNRRPSGNELQVPNRNSREKNNQQVLSNPEIQEEVHEISPRRQKTIKELAATEMFQSHGYAEKENDDNYSRYLRPVFY